MEIMDLGRIVLLCPSCGQSIPVAPGPLGSEIGCAGCGESIPVSGGPPIRGSAPRNCRICGCPHLYWQKRFNQKLGCLIVAAGAALVPWSYGLSLPVVALIDFILYRRLPRISVCYVCKARYLGLPPHPGHEPFDLVTAQSQEARALNWAEGRLRPGCGGAGEGGSESPDGEG
jgi:hypothetical protein